MADGERKDKNVDYTLEMVDELPPKMDGDKGRSSVLTKQLETIAGTEAYIGKWVRIAKYDNSGGAQGAAGNLRARYGKDSTIEGWDFQVRRVDEGAMHGLFACFDPNRVVEGAKATWEEEKKVRLAKLKADKEAKAEAEAKAPTPAPAEAPKQAPSVNAPPRTAAQAVAS
jgi:hypothetical protein